MIVKKSHEYCGYSYTIYKEHGIFVASPHVGQNPIASKLIRDAIETYLQEIGYGYRKVSC